MGMDLGIFWRRALKNQENRRGTGGAILNMLKKGSSNGESINEKER